MTLRTSRGLRPQGKDGNRPTWREGDMAWLGIALSVASALLVIALVTVLLIWL